MLSLIKSGFVAEASHHSVAIAEKECTPERRLAHLITRMKNARWLIGSLILFSTTLLSQAQSLESVLDSMDKAAANFRTAQCDFTWDQYSKVVDDHDFQNGTMYFRRQGDDVEMAADITAPDKKYVVFTNGIISYYQPSIDQVTEYNAGKNKADFESFLVLGFGGRGHDLSRSYDVNFGGMEQVQGVNAAKLVLTPKSQRVRNMFQTITLWIDPARGVSVQQKFDEPSGDYRLSKYNNIRVNQKISGEVFKLKTTSHTKVVKPNG
jgi:outer membrane lipoprotein-sorting protein